MQKSEVWMHSMLNFEADELQQQKTMPVSLLSSTNRKLRLWFRKLEKCSHEAQFLLQHLVDEWNKTKHESMDPSHLVSTVQATAGDVMIFFSTLGPFGTNWASFKGHSLPEVI